VYAEGADFPAASHERALDKLTMLNQQIKRTVGNAVSLSASSDGLAPVAAAPDAVFTLNADKHLELQPRDGFVEWLNLGTHSILDKEIKVFGADAARATGKADYLGQIGVQLDTGQLYISTAVNVAGAWDHAVSGVGSVTDAMLATALNLSGKTIIFPVGLISAQAAATTAAGTDMLLLYNGSALKKITSEALLTPMESMSGFSNLSIQYHDMGFATVIADSIVLEDSNGRRVRRNNVNTDCVMYASGGANKLDVDTPTNGAWYCLWAIHNSTANGTGCDMLFSLNGISPSLPEGYTFKKKLGWVRVLDATSEGVGSAHIGYFLKCIQYGNSAYSEPKQAFYTPPVHEGDPQTPGIAGTVAVQSPNLTEYVPPDAPWLRGILGISGAGSKGYVLTADDVLLNGYLNVNISNGGTSMDSMDNGTPFHTIISTSPSLRSITFRTDSNDTSPRCLMKVIGWDYNF